MFLRAAFHKSWENTHTVSSYAVHSDPNIVHRDQMEDTYFFEESEDKSLTVFGVLDGHNGRAVVQYIATTLPGLLLTNLSSNASSAAASVEEIISETFLSLDEMTRTAIGTKAEQTGTTCSICIVRIENGQKVLYCANIGDTCAHLYEESSSNASVELTMTHRANSTEEKERVKSAGSYVSMNRIEGKLEVFRAFGDFAMKNKGLIATPSVKRIELKSTTAAAASSTTFNIVIACDGLWDFVKKEEIDSIVRSSAGSTDSIAKQLTSTAKKCKSTDNITVMAVSICAA